MKKEKNAKRILIFTILFIFFTLLVVFNSFYYVRLTIADNLYGDKESLDNIVIVAIDDDSIQRIGRWPWDRDVFADILENIEGAKVIGMDLSFFEETSDDDRLERVISEKGNIVLSAEINKAGVNVVIGSYLKKVCWPKLFVGASFLFLEILMYSCGLKLVPAAILSQNPFFEN